MMGNDRRDGGEPVDRRVGDGWRSEPALTAEPAQVRASEGRGGARAGDGQGPGER